jgi:predicted ATPase
VGGCTIEAAEAVCNADGDLPMEVVDGIAALVDKSLLRQEEGLDGEPRLVMLETIREYAQERLEEIGDSEIMRRCDTAYYLALAEVAEPKLHGPELLLWLDLLDQEHDNLRAALRWAIERRESDLVLRLAVALGWFWNRRAYWREGAHWLEAALAQSSTTQTPARAWALFHARLLADLLGDYGRGLVLQL